MRYEDPRPGDQVPRAVAREALALAREALPAYSAATSRKDFTRHQLFAVLALKTFFETDYRGVAQLLADLGDLRADGRRSSRPIRTGLDRRDSART